MAKHKIHPNSLANLKAHAAPQFTSETAKAASAKGAAVRKANKEAREQLQATVKAYKSLSKDVIDDMPSALDILNLQLVKALQGDDQDMVVELAKVIAEYQAPKLARRENTNVEVSADDLSDEEIHAKLKNYFDKEDDDE